jgi:hypothetical protein
MMTLKRPAAVLVTICALTLGSVAGCAGNKSSEAESSTATGTLDQAVKFASCLRAHGVTVPDPTPTSDDIAIPDASTDPTKLQQAREACKKYDPKRDVNPNDPAVHDHEVKMAQCLRKYGVQVADPQVGEDLKIQGDQNDPTIQQAEQKCRTEVPQ